jgi:hypothetical protein
MSWPSVTEFWLFLLEHFFSACPVRWPLVPPVLIVQSVRLGRNLAGFCERKTLLNGWLIWLTSEQAVVCDHGDSFECFAS